MNPQIFRDASNIDGIRSYKFIYSAEIEIFSLIEEQIEELGDSKLEADLTDLQLPNGLFINGVSLNLKDTSSCKTNQIGTNNEIIILDTCVFFIIKTLCHINYSK